MKNNNFKIHFTIRMIVWYSFLFLLVGNNYSLSAQVKKYTSINKKERTTYNFLDSPEANKKQKKDKNLKIVYSDRARNNVYLDPYALKKGEKQDLLTPYYVINRKNDFFELVKLDPSLLGKPKGLLSVIFSGKYNFKDSKNVEYVGWIQKNNLLRFSHPKISEYNYRPIRYIIGINRLNTLFNIQKYVKEDSVHVYETPKLKTKIDEKLLLNQFVYLYKYNVTKTAVLVSNLENMHPTDSAKRIMGWIPTYLVKKIGQQQVFDIHKTDSLLFLNKNAVYSSYLNTQEIASKFIYIDTENRKETIKKDDSIHVSIPLNVWNHYDNKLINVEGNDILIRKLKKVREENKIINFHYVFDCSANLRSQQILLISSLQRIWMQISKNKIYEEYEFNFSASSYGCGTFYKLPIKKSFALWVDFIQKAISNDSSMVTDEINNNGIKQCFDYSLSNLETPSFTNNIIMVVGSKKFEKFEDIEGLTEKLAFTSSRLIFCQLENKVKNEYQDYTLQAKQILNSVGSKYAAFLKAYTVENRLVKKENIFINIPSEDNMYIYDAPENSIYQGALVFPKINQQLYPESFDIAVDTVLTKIVRFNDVAISSLEFHAEKLGFLRSKLGDRMKKVIEHETGFNENLIPRRDMDEYYYENRNFNFNENSELVQGFLLSKRELEVLIDGYRSLAPKMSKEIKQKDRKFIFKLYKGNLNGINKMILRNELDVSSSLSEIFFFKTGFPVQIACLSDISVSDLLSKRRVSNEDFLDLMNYLRTKIDGLEKMLDEEKGIDIKGEGSKYYFIPVEKII